MIIRASDFADGLFHRQNINLNQITVDAAIIDNVKLSTQQWQQLFKTIENNTLSIHTLSIDIDHGIQYINIYVILLCFNYK